MRICNSNQEQKQLVASLQTGATNAVLIADSKLKTLLTVVLEFIVFACRVSCVVSRVAEILVRGDRAFAFKILTQRCQRQANHLQCQ
jgi:hypothetical protein